MPFQTDMIILFVAILFIAGVLTAKFSTRLGVPALVLFILVGMVIGSDGFNIVNVDFEQAKYAQFVGMFALVVILFEGGLQTKWATVKSVALPSLSLATLGVLLTSTIVAVAAKYVLGVGLAASAFIWCNCWINGRSSSICCLKRAKYKNTFRCDVRSRIWNERSNGCFFDTIIHPAHYN